MNAAPTLSVVIPVFNEEAGLPALFERLYPALDALGIAYEVIFVNDGSRDRSAALLREQWERRRDVTRVVLFNANYGQHIGDRRRVRALPWRARRHAGRRPAESAGGNRASCSRRWTRGTTTSAACAAPARIRGGGGSRRAR